MEQNKEFRNTPFLYSQLIFDRSACMYNGLKIVYSINGVRKMEQIYSEKLN